MKQKVINEGGSNNPGCQGGSSNNKSEIKHVARSVRRGG